MSIKARIIVVHPYFKEQILDFQKAACMVQEEIKEGETIHFYCRENDHTEKHFATAKAGPSSILRILPNKGQIHRLLFVGGVRQWQALKPENAKRVIIVEGFKHADDFFNNLLTRGTFTTYQMYFDNLKAI
jgi:hypothetical protein